MADFTDGLLERIAEKERAEREAEIAQQKAQGRVSIIPMPKVPTRPFRSELTVERHAIFVANSYKGDFWRYERTINHPDSGEPVVQRITVGKIDEGDRARGILTQSHQEVLYRVLALWDEQGYPLALWEGEHYGVITTTPYELVNAICGGDAAPHYRRARRLLRDLSSVPIVLENGYTLQGIKDRDEFTLLSIIDWQERKVDKKTGRPRPGEKSEVRVMLSRLVTEGFLRKNVKQLLLGPYKQLGAGRRGPQAGLARLLYARLDNELAGKDEYHVRPEELAKRVGLAPQRYRSKRREQFSDAVRLLDGKIIQGERYKVRVELRESDDKQDYVLVARREAHQLGLFDKR